MYKRYTVPGGLEPSAVVAAKVFFDGVTPCEVAGNLHLVILAPDPGRRRSGCRRGRNGEVFFEDYLCQPAYQIRTFAQHGIDVCWKAA
ncbi:MAG: hypothetical protein ISR64_07825 [Deltaproteobacteria bacterium]|nr:hypothetical protein [Deltaproteobacteria bacterium]